MIAQRSVAGSGTLRFDRTLAAVAGTRSIRMLFAVLLDSPIAKRFALRTDKLIFIILVLKLLDGIDSLIVAAAAIHDRHMGLDVLFE